MIKTQVSQTLHTMFQASYQITEGSKELATAKISENRMAYALKLIMEKDKSLLDKGTNNVLIST